MPGMSLTRRLASLGENGPACHDLSAISGCWLCSWHALSRGAGWSVRKQAAHDFGCNGSTLQGVWFTWRLLEWYFWLLPAALHEW